MKKVMIAAVAAMSIVGFGITHAEESASVVVPAASGSTMIDLKAAVPALLDSSHTLRIGTAEIPLQTDINRLTTNVNFVIRPPQAGSFWAYYDGNRCGWDVASLKLLADVKSGQQAFLMIHKLNIDIKSETACVASVSGATLSQSL